jgi:hypothetical protein
VIKAYIASHGITLTGSETNIQIYILLADILRTLKRNTKKPQQSDRKRFSIEVD